MCINMHFSVKIDPAEHTSVKIEVPLWRVGQYHLQSCDRVVIAGPGTFVVVPPSGLSGAAAAVLFLNVSLIVALIVAPPLLGVVSVSIVPCCQCY